MTNAMNQGAREEHPMVRVVQRMADTMPAHFRKILDGLACDGDMEAIEAMHTAGVLASTSARSAVLPLPVHAADQAAALDVIRKVISVDGEVTSDAIALHFERAESADAVRTLAMLGGDPNQWIKSDESTWFTPLSMQISAAAVSSSSDQLKQILPIMATIDVLRERGVVPLIEMDRSDEGNLKARDLFQMAALTAAKGDPDNFYGEVLAQMVNMEWPDNWRKAAGAAVMDAVPLTGANLHAHWRMGLLANLIAKAEFGDLAALQDMFVGPWNNRGALAKASWRFADPDACGASGVAAVRNILSYGIPVDDIKVDVGDDLFLMVGTFLHSAIKQRNAPMIEAVLDAGADPDAMLVEHPTQSGNGEAALSALELARQYFPESEQMLNAKKARNAIGRVIKQGAEAHAIANGRGCP